ncbi:hypothetical protein AOLI_G00137430 [Acnodon oligacanthus]
MAQIIRVTRGLQASSRETSRGEDVPQRHPSSQSIDLPHPELATYPTQPYLGHVEDFTSEAFWYTPLRTRVNFKGKALSATLDIGTSLSAVRADLVPQDSPDASKTQLWTAPPIQLADDDPCSSADRDDCIMCLEAPASILHDKVEKASLNPEQKVELGQLLEELYDLFDGHLGHTSLAKHFIDTGDARPISLPPYCTSPAKKKIIEDQIQKMLEEEIIEPSSSPWAAPVVIVKKPCGEPRFCVDYRGLNQLTVRDSYALHRFDESLDFLSRGKFLSTIDLARGYWQVAFEERSRPKTAFISHCGLYQFRVLPFGLSNAPATFQRLMNTVLTGLTYKICAVYLDHTVVASTMFEQHLKDLSEVLTQLQSAGLSLKLSKCQFYLSELVFLGYRLTPDGILPDQSKVSAVTDFKIPKNVKEVRGVQNKVPDALSRNPLPGNDAPLDILPNYATIAGLDLWALPPVLLQDHSHLRQLQLNDHETGTILRDLENTPEGGTNELDAQYIEQDGLLYFLDPKSCCSLHPLKQFKLYAPTAMRGTLLRYYYDHPMAGHLVVTKTLA